MRAFTLITAPDTPACHKARAYLRWRNAPFTEKPATALTARAEIRPRLRALSAPLLVAADRTAWSDTREMADALDRRLPGDALRPDLPAARFGCDLVEAWADERLAPAAAFLVWTTEPERAAARLARTAWPETPGAQAHRTARLIGRRLTARLSESGLEPSRRGAIEARLDAALAAAAKALAASEFLFGERPTTADCALFGVVQTLRACAAGRALLARREALEAWSLRVAGPDDPGRGALRRASSNPAAALALQGRAARDFLPEALDAAEAAADWAERHPGRRALPASLGWPGRGRRRMRATDAWLAQRLTDLLGEPDGVVDAEAYRLLKALGLLALREVRPRRRLVRRHHRLELDMRDAGAAAPRERDEAIGQVRLALGAAAREAADDAAVADLVTG